MTKTMKFGVLMKAHRAEIHERPIPELGKYDILVKQETCNICTTDYGQWLGLREHQGYPMAGGHEGAGIIVAKGSKVDKKLQVGDRIAVTYQYCGECEACKTGLTSDCVNHKRGRSEDGYLGEFGFADYNVRDSRFVIKMNKDLPPAEAGFLEPLATVVNGIMRLRLQPKETVVIIGAGTMGLVNAQAAKGYGARVIITELMEKKIKTAEAMGFEVVDVSKNDPIEMVKAMTEGKGADAVILAVGATKANQQAIEMVKQLRGRVLLFAAGYPAPEINVDSNVIHYRKLELIGTFGADKADFIESARLLNEGIVDVAPLIETSFPLSELQKAYEAASTPGNYRVCVELS